MMVPVRCFSCGKLVGDKWDEFVRRVKQGENKGDILDDLGMKLYCCRRMLLSNVDVIDDIMKFFETAKDGHRFSFKD